MTDFDVHSIDTAPVDAKPLLQLSQDLYGGMIPNLHGVMAESPALLEAYQALNEIFNKTSLDIIERNIVWLTINYENDCTYCMAAHTAIAGYSGMSKADISALREGRPITDPKHQALRHFTAHMVETRGWAALDEIDTLLAASYSKATILDVILSIGMKTLSNYTNHIAHTPVDKPFEAFVWEK